MQKASGGTSKSKTMSPLARDILKGFEEAIAIAKGEMEPARIYTDVDVAKIRAKLKLSQAEFAAMIQVSKRVVQEWEQHRKAPSGAARTLLKAVEKHPKTLQKVLQSL
jgi:putative transcriptional regulator